MFRNYCVLIAILMAFVSTGLEAKGRGYRVSPNSEIKTSSNLNVSRNYVVDDFKDGELASNPTWWQFGNLKAIVAPNSDPSEPAYVGRQALRLEGSTSHYFVGGVGTYLCLDGTLYNSLEMVVFGTGSESGRLHIELYDDDNRNYVIEPSGFTAGEVAFDDRFVYDIDVDWYGWKKVTIPLTMFYDNNPGIGNDKWDPDRVSGSGGLVQMQILVNSKNRKGKVNLKIDSIRFYSDKNVKMPLPDGAEILDQATDENLDYNLVPGR
ncbi:hypothetical protein EB093_03100 [bacterium]|nr:hypothetical protein [bacterium]